MNQLIKLTLLLSGNTVIIVFLYHLALRYKYRDNMTRLYNKTFLEKIVTKWILRKKGFEIWFFDIDDFKTINDTYGHLVGDKCILHFSKSLREVVKSRSSVIARIGGDEFAVALIGHSNIEREAVMSNLRNQCYSFDSTQILYTVSIGVCQSERELSYEKLLDIVDKKMYANKNKQKKRADIHILEKNHVRMIL